MSLHIERIFNAVGQGGFYEERFYSSEGENIKGDNIFNFVFDCGSHNKKELFFKMIESKAYQTIDLLCISHFDRDHISLLPQFLNGKTIETLVIPLMTNTEIIYNVFFPLTASSAIDSEGIKFILNPRSYIESLGGSVKKVIYIETGDDKKDNNNEPVNIDEVRDEEKFPSGSDFFSGKISKSTSKLRWIFKPVNLSFENQSHNKDFKKKLEKVLGISDIDQDLKNILNTKIKMGNISDFINQIKKMYEESYKKSGGNFKKKMNDFSMLVYSGLSSKPEDSKVKILLKPCNTKYLEPRFECTYPCLFDFSYKEGVSGCLYTGDSNAKDNFAIIERYYKKYKAGYIQTLQIPHHGSKESWNKDLLDWANDFFISFGENKHGHPNSEVLETIIDKDKNLFCITYPGSSLQYEIRISS
jgi:beta-lactamase superfamily II metal-dependent hydrolase